MAAAAQDPPSGGPIGVLVMSGRDAPELKVLDKLPAGMRVVAVGRSLEDFSGVSEEEWRSVQVLLNCGILKNAAKRDQIEAVWPKIPNLKWMHLASAGIEHVVFPDLVDGDVTLTNASGCFSHSLAEFCLFGCKYFALDFPRMQAAKAGKRWEPYEVEELRGRTMGIIGYGDIGQTCARLARVFRMNVVAYKRSPGDPAGLADAVYSDEAGLVKLAAESDYVVAALPGTPKTRAMIDAKVFAAMKPTAVFVNIGRGTTVDEPALVDALATKKIRGAVLDVFATEPLPEESPLWEMENVIVSPHTADRTTEFQFEALQFFVENAERFAAGEMLHNVVDKKAGY
ncbi:unnamed protein product [Pedinophyceae sp. YPF-701]|nr:unnamed protein product [Pedinophyceae sp. YPF-701]